MNIGYFNLITLILCIALGLAIACIFTMVGEFGKIRFVYAILTLACFGYASVLVFLYPKTPTHTMCFGVTANYKSFGVISYEDWAEIQESTEVSGESIITPTEEQSVLMATYIGNEKSDDYTCYWGLSDSNLLVTNDKELYEDVQSNTYDKPVICFIENGEVMLGDKSCTDYKLIEK